MVSRGQAPRKGTVKRLRCLATHWATPGTNSAATGLALDGSAVLRAEENRMYQGATLRPLVLTPASPSSRQWTSGTHRCDLLGASLPEHQDAARKGTRDSKGAAWS